MTYRTGRKVGRTIYHQIGDEPSDADELVGLMDTPVLAALFVFAMNNLGFGSRQGHAFVESQQKMDDPYRRGTHPVNQPGYDQPGGAE